MSCPSMLAAALRYALDLGRPVLPLVPRDKRPIVARGLRAATTHEETVRAWWTRTPDANIGLLCGFGLLCLDVDGPAGAKSLRQLVKEHGPLPETVESITPRGRHISFGYDETTKIRPSAGRLGEGLDVRADGSYVVAPPSVHPSGRRYRWRRGHEPGEHVLADAPAWLLDLVARDTLGAVPRAAHPTGEQHERAPRRPSSRDHSSSGRDFATCLSMMREGASDDEIADHLRRRSAKYATKGLHAESYLRGTIDHARLSHETSAPRATCQAAGLDFSPAQWGKPPLARVVLDLVTNDGEVARAKIVAPTPGYRAAGAMWSACFPDLDRDLLAAESFAEAHRAWKTVAWVGRTFFVAAHGGQVRWIRAVAQEPAARRVRTNRGAR